MTTAQDPLPAPLSRLWGRLSTWAGRVGVMRKLTLLLILAAIAAGGVTYFAITGENLAGPNVRRVVVLLNIDLAILLGLSLVIARKLVQLWTERRRGSAGSRLHVRMVVMFGAVAVTPAIIVAVFSGLFLNFGLQGWFSQRVATAVEQSLNVAEAYLREHKNTIRAEILAMANDVARQGPALIDRPDLINRLLTAQAGLRSLPEAVIVDGTGQVLARSEFSFSLGSDVDPVPPEALEQGRDGKVVLLVSEGEDRIRALVRLENFLDAYLYVGRFVDPTVVNRIEEARTAAEAYQKLAAQRTTIELTFAMIYVVVALLMLLAAISLGLMLATRLADPIGRLIAGAERVRSGDLSVRLAEADKGDELDALIRSFNRMAQQLEEQRKELIAANQQLDARRRFTEAVLGGVSAGVIGLDAKGRINFPNRSASALLGLALDQRRGERLADTVPAMTGLLDTAARRPREIIIDRDGEARTLLVKVTVERTTDGRTGGYVVTFDDVTELQTAQRTAAWADVARRIAHEIKNPLTPIQLAAERLKRRYLGQITDDTEVFESCVDTIVRQVGDIGTMVDEFSAFARLPSPRMQREDLAGLAREAVFLQQQGLRDIHFALDLPATALPLRCDARQIGQVLTNLLKNAVEAIEARTQRDGPDAPAGRIVLRARTTSDGIVLELSDNGVGLPRDLRDRLTEPYVTTRAKGTGLGLAIVKKIMEDHGGELILGDAAEGGACVRLIFRDTDGAGSGGPAEGRSADYQS